MFKYFLFFCLAIMPLAASEFVSTSGDTVTLEICQEDDLDTCREVFVSAFILLEARKPTPLRVGGIASPNFVF